LSIGVLEGVFWQVYLFDLQDLRPAGLVHDRRFHLCHKSANVTDCPESIDLTVAIFLVEVIAVLGRRLCKIPLLRHNEVPDLKKRSFVTATLRPPAFSL